MYTGFQNSPEISHIWGQYSPWFSVPSDISADVPPTCAVSFVQILSRHGARNPTASKTATYSALVTKLKTNVKTFPGNYSFLANYTYTLGADQLTTFGQQELVNSGIKFFHRYNALSLISTPFVRSSGEARVVESAQNWTQGFHAAKSGQFLDLAYPYPIEVISEDAGVNNTLAHSLCYDFENEAPYDSIASSAQKKWLAVFGPAILTRLNNDLPGANLALSDVPSFMDLCPFNTVDSPVGAISPFCNLFTIDEWSSYNYYESLKEYYGYSYGNPLGPTQGVGFTNELMARLTSTPVVDHTSTNSTLDHNSSTFPLNKLIYADFSHDSDMTAIFSAMGLYNETTTLSNTTLSTAQQDGGYSAAWTVPFAARMYVEKLACLGQKEESVRVIVNDRVNPLTAFGADANGLVPLSKFVSQLSFAREGGYWGQCFL